MNILSSKTSTSRQNRQRSSVVFCVSERVEVILNVSSFPVSQPLLNFDRETFGLFSTGKMPVGPTAKMAVLQKNS